MRTGHDLHYALNSRCVAVRSTDIRILMTSHFRLGHGAALETDEHPRALIPRHGAVSTSKPPPAGPGLIEKPLRGVSVGPAAKLGVPIYTSSPGDSSIGMNIAA